MKTAMLAERAWLPTLCRFFLGGKESTHIASSMELEILPSTTASIEPKSSDRQPNLVSMCETLVKDDPAIAIPLFCGGVHPWTQTRLQKHQPRSRVFENEESPHFPRWRLLKQLGFAQVRKNIISALVGCTSISKSLSIAGLVEPKFDTLHPDELLDGQKAD